MSFTKSLKKVAWDINKPAAQAFSNGVNGGGKSFGQAMGGAWSNLKSGLSAGMAPPPSAKAANAGTVARAGSNGG